MVSIGMGSLAVTTDPERLESGIVSLVYPSSKAALNMVTTQYAKALPGWKVNAVDPRLHRHRPQRPRRAQVGRGGRPGHRRPGRRGADGPTGGVFDDRGVVPW